MTAPHQISPNHFGASTAHSPLQNFDDRRRRQRRRRRSADGAAHLDDVGVAGRFGDDVEGVNDRRKNLTDLRLAEIKHLRFHSGAKKKLLMNKIK